MYQNVFFFSSSKASSKLCVGPQCDAKYDCVVCVRCSGGTIMAGRGEWCSGVCRAEHMWVSGGARVQLQPVCHRPSYVITQPSLQTRTTR